MNTNSPKKILVLAQGLTAGGGLSVGHNIIRCLNETEQNVEYTFVMPVMNDYLEIDIQSPHKVIWFKNKFRQLGRWYFDKFQLPKLIKEINPDWVLGLGNLGVPGVKVKQAVLFHKPQLLYPSKHSVNEVWLKKLQNNAIKSVLRKSLEHVEIVFCQTNTAKNRFKKEFSYSGDIHLWPNAISNKVRETKDVDVPARLASLKDKLSVLILTRYYPHKNLELILEACKRYRDELSGIRFVITIEADQHPMAKELLDNIKQYQLEDIIVNVGALPQEDLAKYYTHTDGLLLPTLLESFSGTYLEAMKFQRPILTSNIDFAEELCGDAAIYFDPWSLEDFVSAIQRFCDDEQLRQQLVVDGQKQRLKYNFDWPETTAKAEELLLSFTSG